MAIPIPAASIIDRSFSASPAATENAIGMSSSLQSCRTAVPFPEAEGKIVSIIDACCQEIAKTGEKKVFLIASEGTIQSGVFSQGLEPYGIEVVVPRDEQFYQQRELIEAVKQNCITEETIRKFVELIQSFSGDTLILGCTEFPVLYSKVPKEVFESIRIFDPLLCAIQVLQQECE